MPTDFKSIGKKQAADPNILVLEDTTRVRPLDQTVAAWKQHWVEHPSDPEQGTPVTCPGPRSCPLDRKPQDEHGERRWPVSRRYAVNVWDYKSSSVKVLIAGPQVFDEFKTVAEVGIDPCGSDWTIVKSGQGRQTKYELIRHDASSFSAAQVTPDLLHDVVKYETPTSTEAIFETLEKYGIDYDSLSVPSFTYEEALAQTMPFGKCRGQTIEQLVSQDEQYAEWLYSNKLEQGALGDPIFVALQAVMERRGLVKPLDEALKDVPEPTSATTAPVENLPQVELTSLDGSSTISVVEGLVAEAEAQGWRHAFAEPEPEPEPSTLVVIVNGNTMELPRAAAIPLIESGAATLHRIPPLEPESETPAEPEPPKLPLPDEVVLVSVGGVTQMELPYAQAAPLVDNLTSGSSFVDEDVAEAHMRAKEQEDENKASDPTPATTPEPPSTSASVPTPTTSGKTPLAKEQGPPWKCSECGEEYEKRHGNYLKHMAQVHGIGEWPVAAKTATATPAPTPTPSSPTLSPPPIPVPAPTPTPEPSAPAVAAESNGAGDLKTVRSRVEEKLVKELKWASKDVNRLIRLLEDECGSARYNEFGVEEWTKLEIRIDSEIALEQATA